MILILPFHDRTLHSSYMVKDLGLCGCDLPMQKLRFMHSERTATRNAKAPDQVVCPQVTWCTPPLLQRDDHRYPPCVGRPSKPAHFTKALSRQAFWHRESLTNKKYPNQKVHDAGAKSRKKRQSINLCGTMAFYNHATLQKRIICFSFEAAATSTPD